MILQKESEIAKERAQIMEKTSDGFEIAEQDLLIRGPGEIFGTRQHGLPELNVSDVLRHKDVLEKAREASKLILEKDPALKSEENGELVRRIEKLFNGRIRLEL